MKGVNKLYSLGGLIKKENYVVFRLIVLLLKQKRQSVQKK